MQRNLSNSSDKRDERYTRALQYGRPIESEIGRVKWIAMPSKSIRRWLDFHNAASPPDYRARRRDVDVSVTLFLASKSTERITRCLERDEAQGTGALEEA